MSDAVDFEALVRQALTPVEPPADLSARVEATLQNLTELAQDELVAWDARDKRDPRIWVRTTAAIAVGGAAGTALVVLRARRRGSRRRARGVHPVGVASRALRDVSLEARKLLP
jgi:hypothetical protein